MTNLLEGGFDVADNPMSFENLSNPPITVWIPRTLFEGLLVVLSGADKHNVNRLVNCLRCEASSF